MIRRFLRFIKLKINSLEEKYFLKNKTVIVLLLFFYILLLLPFLGNVAFDAVVHFAVAEKFAGGNPFIFNLHDSENTIASTSPFWTILLTLVYFISGNFAPLVVKAVSILLWLLTGYILYLISKDIWNLKGLTLYAIPIIWFANVSVVKNSLGGLENILCSLQLLMIYYNLHKQTESGKITSDFITGILLGWTFLTRVDAGALGLILILYFSIFSSKDSVVSLLKKISVIIFTAILILLPWYLYQYSLTSKIFSDSSLARLYTGRRNSVNVLENFIYFHPSAFITLFTAYLPVSIGFLKIICGKSAYRDITNNPLTFSPVVLVIISVLFYSFVVGADQFGRYFLIVYPFFLLTGMKGLSQIYYSIKERNLFSGKFFAAVVIVFFLIVNVYDYYKRVINIEQLESNIYETFYAPSHRQEYTSSYLRNLGFKETDTIKLAVSEVQFRYFVDERVQVLSLDGRSSAKVLKYMNPKGFPDFEKFIEDEKPDIIEVKGWSSFAKAPDWLPEKLLKLNDKNNLLGDWEKQLSIMKIGESFRWKNNLIKYVATGHIRLFYNFN